MSVDLRTTYLGMNLRNPLVVAACPLTGRIETMKRLEEAGASAFVLPSLFEEQVAHEILSMHRMHQFGSDSFPEALSYFPEMDTYNTGHDSYLEHIAEAKRSVTVPVIASLNGMTRGGWVQCARMIEDAGADALELNIYFLATDPDATGEQVEQQYLDLVADVRATVKIPIAVKVGPYFSSLPHMAKRLVEAGASGLVLFNRFLQPDVSLETLEVTPHLVLSTRDELRLPLRWIAILRPRLAASIAASSGVHTAEDVLKLLLVGADVTTTASSLLKHGPGHLHNLLEGVTAWMVEKEYASVAQMKGSLSQWNCPDPAAFERANYIKTLTSYTGTPI